MIDLRAAFNLPPEEAIAYLLSKRRATLFDWRAATAEAKEKAFWVTGVTKLDTLQVFFNAIQEAVAKGSDFQAFKDRLIADLKPLTGPIDNAEQGIEKAVLRTPRLRTIFDTNIQSSYMAGRYKGLQKTKKLLPYWRFDAMIDKRSSPICPPLDGIIVAADDSFWNTHIPPLHFNCRSNITALSDLDLEEQSGRLLSGAEAKQLADTHPAAEGFRHNPATSRFTPEPSRYNPNLYNQFTNEQAK
jgi:SPP1 gp7 family putative phage head morphogenesis protein